MGFQRNTYNSWDMLLEYAVCVALDTTLVGCLSLHSCMDYRQLGPSTGDHGPLCHQASFLAPMQLWFHLSPALVYHQLSASTILIFWLRFFLWMPYPHDVAIRLIQICHWSFWTSETLPPHHLSSRHRGGSRWGGVMVGEGCKKCLRKDHLTQNLQCNTPPTLRYMPTYPSPHYSQIMDLSHKLITNCVLYCCSSDPD